MLKGVILLGGPQKGTRFRPLSLEVPKPLFPVAGLPTIQHHIEALAAVADMKEILLIGYFPASEMSDFVTEMASQYKIKIRYLQEYTALGTAGGIYHFRDQILSGGTDTFLLLNGDVCGDLPLQEMLDFHKSHDDRVLTMLGTMSTRQQSTQYGCIVEDPATGRVRHYVEKPSTFVSALINCGVYVASGGLLTLVGQRRGSDPVAEDVIQLETDVLRPLAGTGQLLVYTTERWWSCIKSPGSAVYANRRYLQLYRRNRRTDRLCTAANVIGDVFVHPTATVDPTAKLGPNVSIGAHAVIGAGVRIKESLVLGHAEVRSHACVLHAIVGWRTTVGAWARVEGTPCDPNPDKPFAKMDNAPLFNDQGRLNPSITILGCNVSVPAEVMLLNSIVLPHKELPHSYKNEIIL